MCHIITLDRIVKEKVSYLLLDKSYYCIFSMIVLGNLSFRVGRLVKSNLIVESVFWSHQDMKGWRGFCWSQQILRSAKNENQKNSSLPVSFYREQKTKQKSSKTH